MLKTGIFRDTRAGPVGGHMDITRFKSQFEVSPVVEDIDINQYNRNTLMNYSPDPIHLEEDMPRENNWSKERLNLRHHGAFEPAMPWRNDDFDIQHHDKDPRGYLEEIPWRKFHEADLPKAKQRVYYSDADPSVPGNGISFTDMQHRISSLRRNLKGYMPWFDESIGSIAAGKTGLNYNTPHDLDVVTDEKDPYAFDITRNQNINRYNNGNLGGKYFIDRTTTDHVIPNASYNFLFQTYRPETPADLVNMMQGTQKLSRLNESQARNIGNQLFSDNVDKTEASQKKAQSRADRNRYFTELLMNNQVQGVGEASKYVKQLYLQNNPKKRMQADVLSLLGITKQEIRWMESQKNVNKQAYEDCMRNIIEMVSAMDGIPVTRMAELRNKIMRARAPEFIGGCSKTANDNKIKNILTSRNPVSQSGKTTRVNGEYDQKSKNQRSTINLKSIKEPSGKRQETVTEPVDDYNRVFTNKRILDKISNELRGVPDITLNESATYKPVRRTVNYERSDMPATDTDMGEERYYDYQLNSWNDSHLIPEQFKR